MKLLALDCATEYCSAALWLDGAVLERAAPPERGQAEQLLDWCASLLAEAGLGLRALDLIAFGRGPGAFTGVRLATSLAQGLALSTGLPVAAVSTLRAIAFQALQQAPAAHEVLVCQDARMHEIYWGIYARANGCGALRAESLSVPDAVEFPLPLTSDVAVDGAVVATGSAFAAFPELVTRWRDWSLRDATAVTATLSCPPRARDVAALAALDGLAATIDAAQAAPVYLRDRVATPPAAPAAG